MKKRYFKISLLILSMIILLTGCENLALVDSNQDIVKEDILDENESYVALDDVASYLKTYEKLPKNYITKKEAKNLGWNSKEGNLWEVTDEKSIGGDRFMNYEEKLPNKDGRVYYECDINYKGGFRGKERLIYSNDGLFYYTEDHYNSFIEIEK